MGKQAIGIPYTNIEKRMDNSGYLSMYSQNPLAKTHINNILNFDKTPTGTNINVAIISYSGYNQEDAIIINERSIHFELLKTIFFRTYETNIEQEQNLKQDQIIKLEEKCNGSTILVNKNKNKLFHKFNESSIVNKILKTDNIIKIQTRDTRTPKIGDKFSSRHGQKGSIGLIMKYEDMPFTMSGIVPDILINPHCIPSRMTIGQIIEALLGKSICLNGTPSVDKDYSILENKNNLKSSINATPFQSDPTSEIENALFSAGFQKNGNETFFCGINGKKMGSYFIGPVYYQRLVHNVIDKIHTRGERGPVDKLTRQPTEGRNNDGALRLGEMEVDGINASGASYLLNERLFLSSDVFKNTICTSCNKTGLRLKSDSNLFICKCGKTYTTDTIKYIEMPYVFNTLINELGSMGIGVKINNIN